MLPRLDVALPTQVTKPDRSVADYLRRNLRYTFSGFTWLSAFQHLVAQVGTDRILFSTDRPYASMAQARAFLDQLPVGPADRARIAHRNAEKLLDV